MLQSFFDFILLALPTIMIIIISNKIKKTVINNNMVYQITTQAVAINNIESYRMHKTLLGNNMSMCI